MSWILFSILAAFIWAIVNTVDKYVLTKWVRKPIIPVMIMGIIGLIAAFIIFLINGFSYLSPGHIGFGLLAGIFYIVANIFYFRAAKIEEISRVAPLFHLAPLFLLILAAIFLGEIFTPLKYLGIFLLVIGAVLISSRSIKIKLGKAFWLMIASTMFFSFDLVITKYLLGFTDFWTIFAYIRIGAGLGLIPIFCLYFGEFKNLIAEHGKKVVGVISANETLNVCGALSATIAAALGFVTLVESLASLQSLFLLIIAVFLSIFYPKILKEEIEKSTVLIKLIAIILMLIGATLIA